MSCHLQKVRWGEEVETFRGRQKEGAKIKKRLGVERIAPLTYEGMKECVCVNTH